MEISTDQVIHIAKLSRLSLSDQEIERYRKELSDILSYMDTLSKADVTGLSPREHAFTVTPHLREDKAESHSDVLDILKNAPQTDQSHFLVPKVIG